MSRSLFVRFALYGIVSGAATSGPSWTGTLLLGVFLGLVAVALEMRVRSWFDLDVAFFTTLAFLASAPLIGATGSPVSGRVLLFGGACLLFCWLAVDRAPGALKLALTSAIAIGPAVFDLVRSSSWNFGLENLLTGLLGARGLLYGAPLLWLGFLGLIGLRDERVGLARLALAAIIPGTLALLLGTDQEYGTPRMVVWLPFLLPGLAWSLGRMRDFALRRPERVVAVGGTLLVVWNLLFMEQYRRRLLPSDDTVSFAQVASNSAGLVSRFTGTPFAWPANWLFAKRFDAPVHQWDGIAGRRLFAASSAATTTIEFGDDPSVFATDAALLLQGFGTRRTCEQGWCRDLNGAGRLLLPLQNVGGGELVVTLRARGQGALSLSLNGVATSVSEMSESLSDLALRVPARLIDPGISVLSLSVRGGGRATLDRLTLERDLATSSAR